MAGHGLQHQGGGGGHRRGGLPLPGGLNGPLRCPQAPPGPAVFRILYNYLYVWAKGNKRKTEKPQSLGWNFDRILSILLKY